MLVETKIIKEPNGSIGYYESIYDSSNILSSVYFPRDKLLYISFVKGTVYSYGNISEEIFKEFENCDSQGKYFAKEIRKNPDKYPFLKEYKLKSFEIEDAKKIIKEWKEANQQ